MLETRSSKECGMRNTANIWGGSHTPLAQRYFRRCPGIIMARLGSISVFKVELL